MPPASSGHNSLASAGVLLGSRCMRDSCSPSPSSRYRGGVGMSEQQGRPGGLPYHMLVDVFLPPFPLSFVAKL